MQPSGKLQPCDEISECSHMQADLDPAQEDCGFASGTWNDAGVRTGNTQLRLRTDWDTYSSDGLQRTFVHELGHFLGLDNFDETACAVSEAAMQDEFDCGAPSVMDGVTINDSLPVVNSTYGGGPKVSCGF
jgi:hypothetical protein